MKPQIKIFLTIIALIIALIGVLIIFIQSSQEEYILPAEGTQNFSVDLKKEWDYWFEVVTWSGDEIINISIMRGEELIYSVLLEGEKLEVVGDPEEEIYPRLGEFQVEETDTYEMVILVITGGNQGSTKVFLIGHYQKILGIDVIVVIIPIGIALICAIIVFPISGVVEIVQKAKEKKETAIETEMGGVLLMEQCFYHKEQAIGQCEKCKRYICSDCMKVFNNPFSGTLLVFAEDFEGSKHNFCPLCYWKSVHEIATSWSVRISHLFTLTVLLIMTILFYSTFFQPMTALFSDPMVIADWMILGFLSIFIIFFVAMILLILYSLIIDGPRRANKAKVKHQEFLLETGIIEDNLD
ncbi:MAG: hypothetical protein ACFFC6_17950 [Promethearchaeota archaeon]